jgi:PAS domain S-box-containing protein
VDDPALTVLLIEDIPGDARLIRELLVEAGAYPPLRLVWADRLATGLARLDAGCIDVALVDLGLPDSQGLATLAAVHARAPAVPVVVLTGLVDGELGLRAMQAGAQDYLVKGQVDGPALARALRYAVERQRTAAALREGERRFRAIFDQTFQFIGLLAPDGTVLEANRAALDFAGVTRDEVIGRPFWETRWWAVSPAVQERLKAAIAEAAQGRFVRYETQHRRADGALVPFDFSLKPVTDEAGQVVLLIPEGRDISARKRLEEGQRFLAEASRVLAASLDYEQTVQQVARLAVPALADYCLIDLLGPDGAPVRAAGAHVDPAKASLMAQLARYPPDLQGPHPVAAVLRTGQLQWLPELSEEFLAAIARAPEHLAVLRALGPTSVVVVPLTSRGRTMGAMLLAMAESGRRHASTDLGLALDLAQRCALALDNARLYEAEQQARRAAERLAAERAAILAQIADGVVLADPAGRITFVTAAARRLFGPDALAPPDPAVAGRHQVVAHDGRPLRPAELPLHRAARHGEIVVGEEYTLRRPDGSAAAVRVSAAPVLAEDGTRLGAAATLHDVTARHALERQKDEFLANVSHDLRTPLMAIKVAIGAVLANEPPDIAAPLHRLFVTIDQSADRLIALVDNLLALTRLQAGREELRLAPCDLRSLAARAARAIEPLAQARGQRVLVELPADAIVVLGEADRLERALLNLLSNAQTHGRAGGTIRLSLVRQGNEAVLAVADDGPGIAPADLERVFDRFYRAPAARAGRPPGSGLGLAIARGLVEQHGGRIWAESTPGAGATFRIALPISPAGGPAPGRNGHEDPGGGR